MNLTNRMIFSIRKSKLGFDETVVAIETTAANHGWRTSIHHDGEENDPVADHAARTRLQKLYLSPPDAGETLLHIDGNKPLAALFPVSVSIYETSAGEVYISAINLGHLSRLYEGDVKDTLRRIAADFAAIVEEFAGPDEGAKATKRWGAGCCLGCGLGCASVSVVFGAIFALFTALLIKVIPVILTRIRGNDER